MAGWQDQVLMSHSGGFSDLCRVGLSQGQLRAWQPASPEGPRGSKKVAYKTEVTVFMTCQSAYGVIIKYHRLDGV